MAGLKVWAYLSRSRWSVGRNSVLLGFLVDSCTQVVRFWVVAREQFNVPVHVGQGVLPIRRRQLGEGYRTVAVRHVVARVQFYRTGGVLDGLFWLRGRSDGVGVGAATPVSGVAGSSSMAWL